MRKAFRGDGPDPSGMNLSEEERKEYEKMTDPKRNRNRSENKELSSEDAQTVSLVEHNTMREEYQNRIEKLERKIEEQRQTVEELRSEKEQAEAKAERLRTEKRELQDDIQLRQARASDDAREISRLKRENSELGRQMKTIETDAQKDLLAELAKSDRDAKSLASEKEALLQRISDLETIVSDLRADKNELSLKLEEARNGPSRIRIEEPEAAGTIRRDGPTDFSSSLFMVPRYEVKLAKSGRYISFEPNIEGAVACTDHRVSVPGLDGYIGYQGSKEYTAIRKNNRLVIYL